jgi:glutamine cyclotransferase
VKRVLCLAAAAVLLTGCGSTAPSGMPRTPAPRQPERLTVAVLDVLPHDPRAFTQGLELAGDTLYEGTGLVGRSSLRAGPVGKPPEVSVSLPEPLFGEGIAVVGATVWQLTWKSGLAIARDRRTLEKQREMRYQGEGWGLCYQRSRDRLVMSDGSARLTFRDPGDFHVTGSVTVTDRGRPRDQLNELECVGDSVYANVWHSDEILRIDAAGGQVSARIDASGLLTPAQRRRADVLNGIAAYPGTDQFLITGKLWPSLFRVRFVPTR